MLAGDFNSDPVSNPNPAARYLIERGYVDSAATPNRFQLAVRHPQRPQRRNGSDGADYGYPDTDAATRIDFILTKGTPYTYRCTNELNFPSGSSTRLDPAYRGSDHLLQLAEIGIASAGS